MSSTGMRLYAASATKRVLSIRIPLVFSADMSQGPRTDGEPCSPSVRGQLGADEE